MYAPFLLNIREFFSLKRILMDSFMEEDNAGDLLYIGICIAI